MTKVNQPKNSGASSLERATNPEASVWVSANAGSGKTYVLSRRVIRLMLEDNNPSELLCLTFTKAAAAEMSNRVFEILGRWTMLETGLLEQEVGELTGQRPSPELMKRARQLFALALDTPGGLKIQTIHAFCEALLHQFPLEANIPGHFEMMDDLDRSMLLEEAQNRVIRDSLNNSGSGHYVNLSQSFQTIRSHASDHAIDKGIDHLIRHREAFGKWVSQSEFGTVSSAMDPLWKHFGLTPQDQTSKLLEEFCKDTAYRPADLNVLADLLAAKGGKSTDEPLEIIREIIACTDSAKLHRLRQQLFLKTDGEARAYLVSHNFMKDNGLTEKFRDEQERLIRQSEQLKSLEVLKASEAIFTVGDAILSEFANLKRQRGLLDFEDLIVRAASLLNRNEISQWIQYKLDGGISHVLVDEAQDTSPLQWQIIDAIIQEFFSGKGASSKIRTLFVVGDQKQSIYSFQGADPAEFDRQLRKIRSQVSGSDNLHDQVSLNESYRSTQEVLSAVDQVFSLDDNRRGLGEELLSHTARKRHKHLGEVLLWDLERKTAKPDKTEWLAPHDAQGKSDAEVVLAKKIADTIKGWISNEERLPGRNSRIRHGDILILVRRRDKFVDAINRELKQQGLMSAGADRLALNQHIAVEDMIALGKFVSTRMDDLSLACILKSPIFGFDEEDLFHLAHKREEKSLFETLEQFRDRAKTEDYPGDLKERAGLAIGVLKGMLELSRDVPVFEFYARVFARHDLRKKYLRRMGNEVGEVIDGFLQTAMNYDSRYGLGLQGFVEWLAAANLELKREVDMQGDEIRVITAHSAKGLEAPIVFLVDPGSSPFITQHAPPVITLDLDDGEPGWLWQDRTANRLAESKPVYEALKSAAEEEYRRLLYVGMTRAADRLIVCGYRSEKDPTYSHWHSMVKAGLETIPVDPGLGGRLVEEPGGGDMPTKWRWVIDNPGANQQLESDEDAKANIEPDTLPPWLSEVPAEPLLPRPISPSGILGMLEIVREYQDGSGRDGNEAMARGNAIHDLMQVLPHLPADQVDHVIEKYFSRQGAEIPQAVCDELKRQILQLLNNPEFASLAGPGSRSEVEITGSVEIGGKRQLVSGRIDRLAPIEGGLVIVDYKTNRNVPNDPPSIPAEYIGQMALYRELVRCTFPGQTTVCKFIWTENSNFMEVPDSIMDEWMASLNQS